MRLDIPCSARCDNRSGAEVGMRTHFLCGLMSPFPNCPRSTASHPAMYPVNPGTHSKMHRSPHRICESAVPLTRPLPRMFHPKEEVP